MAGAVDPRYADDLRNSGVTFRVVYIGSVTVETSVNAMVPELRSQVVMECILHLAGKGGITNEQHEINPVVSRMIGEVVVEKFEGDLNVSSKMLKVIKDNQLKERIPLLYFSLGTQGKKHTETENMFGFIAKSKNGQIRKCHVVNTKDVTNLIDVLTSAIKISTADAQQAQAKDEGFAAPALPPSALRGTTRNDEVTNIGQSQPNVADDVKKQIWYHGQMSRETAQAMLKEAGDFLVRQSDHSPGQYILSGITSDNEHKHLFLLDPNLRVRTKDRQFQTITELIDYHKSNRMAVRSDGNGRETSLHLLKPIER